MNIKPQHIKFKILYFKNTRKFIFIKIIKIIRLIFIKKSFMNNRIKTYKMYLNIYQIYILFNCF